MYSISKYSNPQMNWLEAWVLMDDLDIVNIIHTYFSVVYTGSCCCCLSLVKCYSWVHTIIHWILVSIFDWPMIPTQYMLSHTEPYVSLCFLLWNAASVPITLNFPRL